ncbi:penicillin-binding protein activator [Paracoccus pacificus]|uniref:Penicillin-binding protein activator n=1 Tax=Paracoccus pacificus TaxID=1463598 RepID=A0ABW4R3W7_9RHOB
MSRISPRPVLRVGAILTTLWLAACGPMGVAGVSGPNTGQMIDPRQPVPVALLVPAGAGSSEMSWLSRSLVNSAKMAAADAQGAQIDLRVYEVGLDAASAASTANKAVDEGAKIILGPLHADSANAAGSAVAARNVNVLAFSNNPDIAGGNVFILGNTFSNVADRLVSYGVRQGKRRIMIVAEDDIPGQIGAGAIRTAISRNGASLAGEIKHPVSQAGIDSVVPGVADAARSGRVDALFLTANQQQVLPYLTGKLNGAGVNSSVTQMMGLTRWDIPAARLQLPGVQGGWFAIPDMALKGQFDSRYRAAYGETPHDLGSLAYDGVSAIAALVRAGKANALTTAGLTTGSGFAGVNGTFRLNRDGTNQRGLAVATIRGGQVVVIDPAPRRFSGAGF